MGTGTNRHRHRRHGDMGRRQTDHFMQWEYPGEFAHRYSENMQGDPRDSWYYEQRRSEAWEQNPGGGSYGYNYYPRPRQSSRSYGEDDFYQRTRLSFRERNSRYRNRVRRYRMRRRSDYDYNIDREHMLRQYGSVDEHLNQYMPGAHY